MPTLHNGTLVDQRYQINDHLGTGGMGTVYLAQDLQDQTKIAIKILNNIPNQAIVQKQFQREFFLLSQMQHPHIIQTHHWGQYKHNFYFTMDYVPGKTLAAIIANKNTQEQMREKWIYSLLHQLSEGLAYIHNKNIIHADLKPSNIIISETENDIHATLLDFGLTQLKHQNVHATTPFSSPIGTAEYMSPEQAKGLQIDHRADLYSLGVMLYELLTGHPPFTGEKPIDILLKHIREIPKAPQTDREDFSISLRQIVLKLLEKDPLNRYPSATDLSNAIQPLKANTKLRRFRPLNPQFSGRETETTLLKNLLDKKTAKLPRLIFVSGEAGIGKSRLLEEFQSEARIQGINILTGSCLQDSSAPFAAISDALKYIHEQNEPDTPLRLDDVLEILKKTTRTKPTLLCIEDIQWIDEWTQRLLRILTYENLPITLYLTSRQTHNEYPKWLAHLAQRMQSTHCHLNALSELETNRLMASILGEQKLPDTISEIVYNETGGHPLFITQLTRSGLESNALKLSPTGQWQYQPQNAIPSSLTDTLQQRIQSLPQQQRAILESVSVLQEVFSFDQVQALSQASEEHLLTQLHALCAQDILHQKNETYYFSHALLQKSIYEHLSRKKQRQLHLKAGLYFEAQDPEKHIEHLAYHFSKSQDKKRAYTYLNTAGKKSRKAEDYRQAEAYFEEALNYLTTEQIVSIKPEDIRREAEFLCDYAYVLWSRSKYVEALNTIEMVFPLVKDNMAMVKTHAIRVRGYIFQVLGRTEEAEVDLLQALNSYNHHNNTLGAFQVLVHLSSIYGSQGQHKKSETCAHQAAENRKRYSQTMTPITVQVYPGQAAFLAAQYQKAQRFLEVAQTDTSPDRIPTRAKCLEMLNRISFFDGQLNQAKKQLHELIAINRKQGKTNSEAWGLTWLGELALEQNLLDQASSHVQEALHLMSQIGERPILADLHAIQAAILAAKGQHAEALDWIHTAIQKIQKTSPIHSLHLPTTWCNLARAYEKMGQIGEAESAYQNAITSRQKLRGGEWGMSFIKAAEFYIRQGNNKQALEHLKTAATVCEEMDLFYLVKKAKHMQNQITEQSRLDILYKTCEDLISILDLNQLLDATLSRILKQSNASRAIVALKNEEGEIEMVRTHNVPGIAAEEISKGIIHQAVEENKIIISLNAYNDERFFNQQSVIDYNIQAVLCLPLYHIHAGVIGALYVDHQGLESFFTDADEAFLGALGHLISIAIINAQTHTQLQQKAQHLQEQLETQNTFGELVGKSQPMQEIYTLLKQAAQTDITVLLQGETGTGKELAARAIHYNSDRKKERFFAQNCSAMNSELLQSELFGHKKGAFTSAVSDHAGIFEAADGGTVFLDEIGDASPQVQASLLRVLEDGEIRRVGDNSHHKVNVRVIAATNRDLTQEVAQGNFREDLFYRLQVLQIVMPPLRQRPEDIPFLADHFLKQISGQQNKTIKGFTQSAITHLITHDWPGNVRELENEIQRAVALSENNQALSSNVFTSKIQNQEPSSNTTNQTLKDQVEALEKQRIIETLQQTQGNISQAASILGLTRHGLYKKIARYDLPKQEHGNLVVTSEN